MADSEAYNQEEARLWRELLRREGPAAQAGDCPEALTVAAYLDGRLGLPEQEAVEQHLSRCPRCVAEVRECRELGAQVAMVAPAEAVRRARSLAVKRPRRRAPAVVWRVALRWSAAAVLALSASYLGLGAGRRTAQDQWATASALGRAAGAGTAEAATDSEPSGDALAMLMGGELR
jgi:anti-sigma factor RsiW